MHKFDQSAFSPPRQQSRTKWFLPVLIALAALAVTCSSTEAKKDPKPAPVSFQREETMILNLERAPKSAKYLILMALRQTRESEKGIDRAIRQVEQADATFAKARNKRDSRTMDTTVGRLKAALATAQQLETQLQEANQELKSDVQQTLVAPR